MYLKIPIKKNGNVVYKEITITDLSDNQLKVGILSMENKNVILYNDIRKAFREEKEKTFISELNHKVIFNEKILNELYKERKFRENDSVVTLNFLFDKIYESQIDDYGDCSYIKAKT